MQTDHAAAGVGRRRSDPDDEGDAGVGHPAALSGRSVAGVPAPPQPQPPPPAGGAAGEAPFVGGRGGAVRGGSSGRKTARATFRAPPRPGAAAATAGRAVAPTGLPEPRPDAPGSASHASGCRLSHSKR